MTDNIDVLSTVEWNWPEWRRWVYRGIVMCMDDDNFLTVKVIGLYIENAATGVRESRPYIIDQTRISKFIAKKVVESGND